MWVVKAMTNRIQKVDDKLFAKTLHGAHISAKDYPGVLSTSRSTTGDLDRESFLGQGPERQADRDGDAAAASASGALARRYAQTHAAPARRRAREEGNAGPRRNEMGELIQLVVSARRPGRSTPWPRSASRCYGRRRARSISRRRVRDAAGFRHAGGDRLRRAALARLPADLVAAMLVLGAGFRWVIVEPLIKHGVIPLVITTLGLSIGLKQLVKAGYSAETHSFPSPFPAGRSALGPSTCPARTSGRWSSRRDRLRAADVPQQDGHQQSDAGVRAEHDPRGYSASTLSGWSSTSS